MSQLEYGDYYKFTASAGIALLVAAGLLPWAFLHESFDLTIATSKIALLTPEAQTLIQKRQDLLAVFINVVPWVSAVMALVGAFLTGYGLLKWRARQAVRDRGEDLEVEKKDKELQAMSQEEVEQKARDDAESLEDQPVREPAARSLSAATVYLENEGAVLSRLRECFGSKILSNQRLGNAEFDAIITEDGREPVIVEIKYIRKGFRQGWLNQCRNSLAARTQLYSNTFSKKSRGVLLIVLGPESRGDLSDLIRGTSDVVGPVSSSRFDNIRIATLRATEVLTIPCEDLKNIFL